jgi:hypothetical protein
MASSPRRLRKTSGRQSPSLGIGGKEACQVDINTQEADLEEIFLTNYRDAEEVNV